MSATSVPNFITVGAVVDYKNASEFAELKIATIG
jgi:hypothetical protein